MLSVLIVDFLNLDLRWSIEQPLDEGSRIRVGIHLHPRANLFVSEVGLWFSEQPAERADND